MKAYTYILALILAATALWSCSDDNEPSYVRQDQMTIKTFPITAITDPYILSDGSIVTVVEDVEQNHTPDAPQNMPQNSYRIVKLGKDGTITKSPKISFKFGKGTTQPLGFNNDDEADFDLEITNNGDVYLKYHTSTNGIGVATFASGVIIDTLTTYLLHNDKFVGSATLNDGRHAIIHGNNATMSIYNCDGVLEQDILLPYIYCNDDETYNVVCICGNIMIIKNDERTEHDFFVYSPDGVLLNYGVIDEMFDRLINIVDTVSNTSSHAYAVTGSEIENTENGGQQSFYRITKLNPKGGVIYQKDSLYMNELYNIVERDGITICAGCYVPQSYEKMKDLSDLTRAATSLIGKIAIFDAETGDSLSIKSISLEGGVMPYAVIPDGNGEYDIYMSRVFSYNSTRYTANFHTESIYIYHIDDLDKLDLE